MALEQLFGGLCRAAMTLALPQGLPKVGRAVARAEELRGMLGPRFGNSAAPCNRSALLLLGVGRAIRAFGRCFVWLVIPKYRLEWANREGWTLLAACCNGNRAQRHGDPTRPKRFEKQEISQPLHSPTKICVLNTDMRVNICYKSCCKTLA